MPYGLCFPFQYYSIMFVSKLMIWLLLALANLELCTSTTNFYAKRDQLKQGDEFGSSNPHLCSANGNYCLSFGTGGDFRNTYLTIYDTRYESAVWYANRNEPLLDVSDNPGTLTLDHSGMLKIISQRDAPPVILYPPPPAQTQEPVQAIDVNDTVVATLFDSGNFILQQVRPGGSRSVLWQSFDHLSDSLIPGMRLGLDHKTGKTWSLVSGTALSLPASGPFTLEWEPNIEQLIIRMRGKVYWASGRLIKGEFENIPKKVQRLYNYTVVSNKDEQYFTYTTEDEEYSEWTLDFSGLLTTKNTEIANSDKCYGYNSDGGCQLWDQPPCRNIGEFFEAMNVRVREQNMTFNADQNASLSLSDCKATCWSDCDCVGYSSYSRNGTGCVFYYENSRWYTLDETVWRIYYLVNRTSNYTNQDNPWQTPAPSPGPMGQDPGSNASKKKIKWVIAVIIIIPLFIICAFILWLLLKKRRKLTLEDEKRARMEYPRLELDTSSGYENANKLQNYKTTRHDLKLFSYASILEATNSFSSEHKLGEGGFGSVYKGKLQNGKEVAIKRLSRSSRQGVIQFKNELTLISELQHTNLVQLMGCCIHVDERILIYEFMANKSLDFFLFSSTRSSLLDWKKRFNIIEGIAQGLIYLHKYSRLRVVHRDVKASNILLDENMNPKISDFGLAKIITEESERNTTRIVGTYGYMPPESAMGVFSIKSDVYSFGILILEIVSGRRNNSSYNTIHALNIVGHTWKLWKEGLALEMVDPIIKDSIIEDQVLRCIHIGLLCVEECANDRPTMANISSLLTNEGAKLPTLKRPAFCFVNESLVRSCNDSTNGLTISDLFAR